MMSSEGEMRERERRAWRTALPILPVVPVRASILILYFLGGIGDFEYSSMMREVLWIDG